MTTYISMLRGINVSGQKKIKMTALKGLYESLGFQAVETYIQSGNVVFDFTKQDTQRIGEMVAKGIKETFGFEVFVLVKTKTQFAKVVKTNPYRKETKVNPSKLHVTFLHDLPKQPDINKIDDVKKGDDSCQITGQEIYLYCPNGYGRTKLTNKLFERLFATKATTRNWNSVCKLMDMASNEHRLEQPSH